MQAVTVALATYLVYSEVVEPLQHSNMSLKRKSPEPDRPLREGEWMCASCNAKNYSARITCYKCPMTKQESEVRLKGKSALDWECYKCKANNFSFRNTCFKCLISKRESDFLKADREGVPWCCRFCNLENFPHRRDCFKCKRIKEDADVIPPRRMMSPPRRGMSPPRRGSPPPMMGYPRDRWDRSPPRPGMFSRGRSPMRGPSPPRMMPGRSRSPPMGRRLLPSPPRRAVSPLNKAVPMETEGEWRCQLCNTGNVSQRRDCYKCTTPRGESGAGPGTVQGSVHSRIGSVVKPKSEKKLKKGQWICTACDVVCYANRKECFKCKAAKDTVARSEDLSLSITIDNTPKEKPQVLLNHSMKSEPDTPPVKRARPNEGAPSLPARNQWGPDWTCRFCRVDVFPKRGDCFKCGRLREECDIRGDPGSSPRFEIHGAGPRDRLSPGPRARGGPDPRDRLGLDPRDRLGPGPGDRYIAGPRDRFSPGPRDRYRDGPDPRDRCGPGPRDAPGGSGPPAGYTCRCGNFNRMTEPDCVRCGRPNEHRMDPRELWLRGGPSRSPPRFYSNTPRNRPPSPPRKVNNKDKKYAPDWNCSKCNFSNFAKRAKCKKCSAKKEDVEDKTTAAEKTPKPSTSEKVDSEVVGKTLSEEMDMYIALWHECEADSEKKLIEGEVDRKKIMRMKRIAKRLLTKQTKKDPDSEETKTAKEKYDCLCSLHQKSIRDIKGSDLDWDCSKCDAYNWANRDKCFKCAAEKPVPDQGDAENAADGEPSNSDAAQQNPETSNTDAVEGTADSNPVETEKDAVKAEDKAEEDKVTITEETEEAEEKSVQKEEAREELMTPENCSDKDVNFGQDY